MNNPGFPRCSGFAELTDFHSREWKEAFHEMERSQTDFLSKENSFRSKDYRWPRDPLHTWSRAWEYPYVYLNLFSDNGSCTGLRIADIGSGVTFFPFALARMGNFVKCYDIDPICQVDLAAAAKALNVAPESVSFSLCSERALEVEDGTFDRVYCVSVLEHVNDKERLISEMYRILRPGGLLIVTMDVDLRGDHQLDGPGFSSCVAELAKKFSPHGGEGMRLSHPLSLLTSRNSPFKQSMPMATFIRRILTRKIAYPVMGRGFQPVEPYYLAVCGLVLAKG